MREFSKKLRQLAALLLVVLFMALPLMGCSTSGPIEDHMWTLVSISKFDREKYDKTYLTTILDRVACNGLVADEYLEEYPNIKILDWQLIAADGSFQITGDGYSYSGTYRGHTEGEIVKGTIDGETCKISVNEGLEYDRMYIIVGEYQLDFADETWAELQNNDD